MGYSVFKSQEDANLWFVYTEWNKYLFRVIPDGATLDWLLAVLAAGGATAVQNAISNSDEAKTYGLGYRNLTVKAASS